MDKIIYMVDYPDPSYIKEALRDSTSGIKQSGRSHSCFAGGKADLSLVMPWSNPVDWWWRCNLCGKIIYAYDCQDSDNDIAFKSVMDKVKFAYTEKDFLECVDKFLEKLHR